MCALENSKVSITTVCCSCSITDWKSLVVGGTSALVAVQDCWFKSLCCLIEKAVNKCSGKFKKILHVIRFYIYIARGALKLRLSGSREEEPYR